MAGLLTVGALTLAPQVYAGHQAPEIGQAPGALTLELVAPYKAPAGGSVTLLARTGVDGTGATSGTRVLFGLTGANGSGAKKEAFSDGGGTAATTYSGSVVGDSSVSVCIAAASTGSACASGSPRLSASLVWVPKIVIGDRTVDESAGTASFEVTLTPTPVRDVTLKFSTLDGSARQPDDYSRVFEGPLTIPVGVVKGSVTVPIAEDVLDEFDETFSVELSEIDNVNVSPAPITWGVLDDPEAVGTISDNDAMPTVSLDSDVSVVEGNSGTVDLTFTARLSALSGRLVNVPFGETPGTATASVDYVPNFGQLALNPGAITQSFTVKVNGDLLDEDDETFTASLSNPVNAVLGTATRTGTIRDDDATPVVSVADVSVDESAGSAAVTVLLSAPSGKSVTASYATSDETATSADYTAATGTLTFGPGQTSKTVDVPIVDDGLDEADETLEFTLSNVVDAIAGDVVARVTIRDDDASPVLSVGDVEVDEGDSGTTTATFTVTVSPTAGRAVTVGYSTADLTAESGSDYVPANGVLTFAVGETTKTVAITVNGDSTFEPDEQFELRLGSPSNAGVGDGAGLGTIRNDDRAPASTAPTDSSDTGPQAGDTRPGSYCGPLTSRPVCGSDVRS